MVPDEPRPDGGLPPGLRVPDDARDLHRDVAALARERRAQRRRRRLGRVLGGGGGRPVPGRVVVVALAVVSVFAALPVVLHPAFPQPAGSLPLASPAAAPGTVGGLLPEGRITTPAGTTTTRALPRPGALVLVPVPCDEACGASVGAVVGQLLQATRSIRLISPRPLDPVGDVVSGLRAGAARGLAASGVDERAVLAPAYAARGVTVLTLAPDGVVLDVVRDVTGDRRLDAEVGRLLSSR